MATPRRPEPLLSLLEISRQTKTPYARIAKLFSKGLLPADFQSGSAYLYRPSRLPSIIETIQL